MQEQAVYERALRVWKPEEQAVVWLEELSELQQEICKLLRLGTLAKPSCGWNLAAVAEEMADVEIILGEMKLALGITEMVEAYKRQKLERLIKRIEVAEAAREEAKV